MKFLEVIVILTIALTVVWSAGDNQDEDDDQDHSIWPTHEFIVKKTQWNTGSLVQKKVKKKSQLPLKSVHIFIERKGKQKLIVD
jgi:hypothetical protein